VGPGRSARAIASGATAASEEAVERALEWLARHQDADGRWNGGTQKTRDERIAPGEVNFTQHCPPGDPCAGECHYHEADTAMTGLALLSFLGAGYTQRDGKYAEVVDGGLRFLLRSQSRDGDLRGDARGVGMYCHAIATLALSEALALTGDSDLREPVERAVRFIAGSRAGDGLGWRYTPGDPSGSDTSILGWVVLALKSAREAGIETPESCRTGALNWLNKVAQGPERGLAIYGQATETGDGLNVTPTMTAEAWVCRQFLGVGGPGRASEEAARYLLAHRPTADSFNLYYWYYGTLAMHQHGGSAWTTWNAMVRDELVRNQARTGHAEGSWDPQLSKGKYDPKGGRIYSTALAALTLEVYYRYLRLEEGGTAVGRPRGISATGRPDNDTRSASEAQ
jgi:hypothetical protein